MKFVLIGAGQRGMIYAKYAQERGHEIAAVAEPEEGSARYSEHLRILYLHFGKRRHGYVEAAFCRAFAAVPQF